MKMQDEMLAKKLLQKEVEQLSVPIEEGGEEEGGKEEGRGSLHICTHTHTHYTHHIVNTHIAHHMHTTHYTLTLHISHIPHAHSPSEKQLRSVRMKN